MMWKSIDTGVAPMRHARFIWYGSEALEAPRPAAGAKTRGGRKEALPPKNGRCVHFNSMPAINNFAAFFFNNSPLVQRCTFTPQTSDHYFLDTLYSRDAQTAALR